MGFLKHWLGFFVFSVVVVGVIWLVGYVGQAIGTSIPEPWNAPAVLVYVCLMATGLFAVLTYDTLRN